MTMVATASNAAVIDGCRWIACTKALDLGCNWLVPEEQPDQASRGRCLPDSLIRREPAADDTIAVEKLVSTTVDLRRLIYQLLDIGLPVDPFWRAEGRLAFDLLSSYSTGQKIVIGHAGGVITIDLTESLDAHRESLRVRLGEPYRTMLGHFRHEVGHYYQNLLVETGPGVRYLDECRELFGDERADYQGRFDSGRRSCARRRSSRHRSARLLRRRPHRAAALRLEVVGAVFQPHQHLDGQTAALPLRDPAPGDPQTGLRTQGDSADRARQRRRIVEFRPNRPLARRRLAWPGPGRLAPVATAISGRCDSNLG
jgi:hypothetical protein